MSTDDMSLDRMFEGHAMSGFGGGSRMALVLIKDDDGDYAIAKITTQPDDMKIVGWIHGEENAVEFASAITAIAKSDNAVFESATTIDDVVDAMLSDWDG